MIDLLELQNKVYNNTKRLGYDCDKNSITEKLLEEVEEYRESKKLKSQALVRLVKDSLCDKAFMSMYEKYIKDTEPCELVDFIFIALSRLKELNIDPQLMIETKEKYNRFRKRK